MTVKDIIRNARGRYTQTEFKKVLEIQYQAKISQGLLSKYESGKVNPPANFIDLCMKIIHDDNISGEVSLNDLEKRIRSVLMGPAKAEARKAFAIILERLS